MDRSKIKDTVLELHRQGKSPKQIAAALHIPVQTVYELTQDISKGNLNDSGLASKLQVMADFPVCWVAAINPIRRYYGHEPMELHIDQIEPERSAQGTCASAGAVSEVGR